MKVDKLNDTDYRVIFVKNFFEEKSIIDFIKKFLNKYQGKLNLKGFYKIIVFNRYFGLYLKFVQIDDSYYKNTFDYNIVFDNNSNFYFKTTDYFVVRNCQYVYYYEGYFYALVDDSFDKILEKVEFGFFGLESDFDFFSKDVLIK